MWVKVVVAVEENLALMLMLLPKNWWVYSENQGSFCQMGLKWISSDGELAEGYQNWRHLWMMARVYFNDAMVNARNACRLRCQYRWKRKNRASCDIEF